MTDLSRYTQHGAGLTALIICTWLVLAPIFSVFANAAGKENTLAARQDYISELETRLEASRHDDLSAWAPFTHLQDHINNENSKEDREEALRNACQTIISRISPEHAQPDAFCILSNRAIAEGWDIQSINLSITGGTADIFSALEDQNLSDWVVERLAIISDQETAGSRATLNISLGFMIKSESSEIQ